MGQEVLVADIAELLGLNGLKFGTLSDPALKAPTGDTAILSSTVQHCPCGAVLAALVAPSDLPLKVGFEVH